MAPSIVNLYKKSCDDLPKFLHFDLKLYTTVLKSQEQETELEISLKFSKHQYEAQCSHVEQIIIVFDGGPHESGKMINY